MSEAKIQELEKNFSNMSDYLRKELNEINNRIKALEDLNAEFARVFIGAPKEQTKQAVVPAPLPPTTQTQPASQLDEYVIFDGNTAKPRSFIADKGLWQALNTDLKAMGYHWVSAGKDSRWQR